MAPVWPHSELRHSSDNDVRASSSERQATQVLFTFDCINNIEAGRREKILTAYYNYRRSAIACSPMSSEIKQLWRRVDAVCFDVDSTVIQEEGIDELAKFCDKGNEVSSLTSKAMAGGMTFQEALKLRLDIIQPTLTQMKDFIKIKSPTLTPGIKKLVDFLHRQGVPVYLISGGFRCIIAPVAQQLNIPYSHIFANRLKFYFTGEYAGFDENEPTSKSGGKAVVIDILKRKHGYKTVIVVGDGMTDLEASPPADAFIGYGGNVIRDAVKAKAKWYITDFNELILAYQDL